MSSHQTPPQDSPEERLRKLEALRAGHIAPYGGRFARSGPVHALVTDFAPERRVTAAGRLVARRGHGGLIFADLRDSTGKIQLCLKRDQVGEERFRIFDLLDLGDVIGVSGTLFKTKTGEVTILTEDVTVLAKALRPLPEKWHGLKDVEIRYRQRYLDLIANEDVRLAFAKRSALLGSVRTTLERRGFLEVETPMMHVVPGGAAGEPFVTHHAALDLDLYLRLAPELYLKRLLVGGMDRVYELNRSFRNEGLSTQHNPEFTMLEAYAAYEDYRFMMTLVQDVICEAARALRGSLTFEFRGQMIDLSPPWEEVSFAAAMAELGLEPGAPEETLTRVLKARGIRVAGRSRSQMVRLVEQLFEPKARTKPLFVTDYWTELSPLARSVPGRPEITERFELFIGGMEVANAYSELNDPLEQRRRFEAQLEGAPARERARLLDEGFLEALEHGMPPAGGLGVGIDRLAMLLLGQPSIKDVILFPLLRPSSRPEST
ncbi:MAG TPA: lysine--tRNA ligase [bacterium]